MLFFLYTKDHPGFFTDEGILKIREISSQLDKEIEKDFEERNKPVINNIYNYMCYVQYC